jgi:hypothetical protein
MDLPLGVTRSDVERLRASSGGIVFVLEGRAPCERCRKYFDSPILVATEHGLRNRGGPVVSFEAPIQLCPTCDPDHHDRREDPDSQAAAGPGPSLAEVRRSRAFFSRIARRRRA